MHYLSGGLSQQNKFLVKLIGPKSVLSLATCVLLINRYVCACPLTSSTSDPHPLCRSSRSQMSLKKDVLKNFANFTGKHLFWSLFLIKLHTPLLKRDSNTGVFL